jgi:hypothetical protein
MDIDAELEPTKEWFSQRQLHQVKLAQQIQPDCK